MASVATIAKEVLKALFAMGMGGAAGGGIASGVASRILGNMSGQTAGFTARSYPDEFAPDRFHNYTVHNIPGPANWNSEGKENAETIEQAGRMQELEEHNKAIRKFVRPGMTPKQEREALQLGLMEEKALPAFWNESESRVPFSVSSSAVTGIRLAPDGRIEVQWRGKPTWYTFKQYPDTYQASLAAQKLLRADSIGRAVFPVTHSKKYKELLAQGLGTWNDENYDGAMAR